jgi:hypothetical protein
MKREPNKADAPNAAMTLLFHSDHHWRGVGDLRRSAARALMVRFTLIIGFAVLLGGCAVHRSSPVAHISQASKDRYEVRVSSVEWCAGGPCNFPQWPHREYSSYWITTDTTNGVVPADHLTLTYGGLDGFRVSQEGPLRGSVSFLSNQLHVALQLPAFSPGADPEYKNFPLNGTYTIESQ